MRHTSAFSRGSGWTVGMTSALWPSLTLAIESSDTSTSILMSDGSTSETIGDPVQSVSMFSVYGIIRLTMSPTFKNFFTTTPDIGDRMNVLLYSQQAAAWRASATPYER